MMDFEKLFRLMSLRDDEFKWYESWDDHWEWLSSHKFISLDEQEVPSLTPRGRKTIKYIVLKAQDVI